MSIDSINELSINDIQDIKNSIDKYISLFCSENNIQDIKDINQSVWNGCLLYVYYNYIKPSEILINPNDRRSIYDIYKCSIVCDYYIYLCRIYDKECSLWGYSYLTGIEEYIIHDWYNNYKGIRNSQKATERYSYIYKKLVGEREKSLSDRLLTGKNPVGVLGILNHFYGWAGTGNMTEDRQKQAVTLSDLRTNAAQLTDSLTKSGENMPD